MKYIFIVVLCLFLVSCDDPTTVSENGSEYKINFIYTNSHSQKIVCVNDLKQWCAKNSNAEIISICPNSSGSDTYRTVRSWLIVYKDGVTSAEIFGK